ncbi:MAG TPA: tetratricopeptide repeat protein [Kofleriaceae bacterium]|nr:tetratricopeptide repeat protein [Kofleriaceae bacterium]
MRMLVVVMALAEIAGANPYRARELVAEGRAESDDGRALAHFEQAIDQDVDALEAYEAAIPLWIRTGQLAAMRRRLERVTLRHPRFAPAWYALGYAYRQAGRPELAVLAYRSYVSLRPGEAAPYFGLAMAYKSIGRPTRAERTFLRYLRLERDPAQAAFVDQARAEVLVLALRRLGLVPALEPGAGGPP